MKAPPLCVLDTLKTIFIVNLFEDQPALFCFCFPSANDKNVIAVSFFRAATVFAKFLLRQSVVQRAIR